MATGQIAEEARVGQYEAAFESDIFEDGTMPRVDANVLAEMIGDVAHLQGTELFQTLRRTVEALEPADEWNAEFTKLLPKGWLRPAGIANDLYSAACAGVVLSPTLAHAAATHPDKHVLRELGADQPLSVTHAAAVLRDIADGPKPRFWNGELSTDAFLDMQKRRGTPDSVIEQAQAMADDPDAAPLTYGDYRTLNPSEQPDYVIRGLTRELGLDEALVRRLVPDGVDYLQSGRRYGRGDLTLDGIVDAIKSNNRDGGYSASHSLLKRGIPAIAALLLAATDKAASGSSAYDTALSVQYVDNPFPELRSYRDALEDVAFKVVGKGQFGYDSIGWGMYQDAPGERAKIVAGLAQQDRFDGELLTRLCDPDIAPSRVWTAYKAVEAVGRIVFGVEKAKVYYD